MSNPIHDTDRRRCHRQPLGMCRLHLVALRALARQKQWSVPRLSQAMALAALVHDGQTRLGSGEPYLVHPLQTARLVGLWGGAEDDVVAALLHDAVEDATGDPQALQQHILDTFGEGVAQAVDALSKRPHLEGAMARQQDQCDRIRALALRQGPGVCLVKLADRAHNCVTSQFYSPQKLLKLQAENQRWLVPMAMGLGAMTLARFLDDASQWHAVPEACFAETLAPMLRQH